YLVVSWFILQFVEVVFPMLGLDDEVLGRNILIVLAIGLPITLLLSWLFEITPQGIKRESDIDRNAETPPTRSRLMDRVIIVVLLIAVGLLLADRFVLEPASGDADTTATLARDNYTSVAVLPFADMSEDGNSAFFADGLTESLLHQLAQVPDLRVPARTSVFSFRNREIDVREIANSLNVETVLDGSVRYSGDRIRITAQLIEAESGFQLWSKTFDKTLDDIFQVQDEIADSVTNALVATLIGAPATETPQLAGIEGRAYELYLKGLEQKNIASYGSLPQAESLFKQALVVDSDFVDAKVDLALVYYLQAETGLITWGAAHSQAQPLLEQVIKQDADNPRALAQLAIVEWQSLAFTVGPNDPRSVEAAAAMEETVALAPNVPALFATLSVAAAITQRNDDALLWLERGLAVDPLSARLLLSKGRILLEALDRPAEAAVVFDKARQSAPDWTAVDLASANAAFAMNDITSGLRWYLRAMDTDPEDHEIPAMTARVYSGLGMDEEADTMALRASTIAPSAPWTRSMLLVRQLGAGNLERAATMAEQMLRDEIQDRGFAWGMASFGYVSAMIDLGRVDDVGPFLETVREGITSDSYQPTGLKEVSLRFAFLHAMVAQERFDEVEPMSLAMEAHLDQIFPGWRQDDFLVVNVYLTRGDIDKAIEHAQMDLSGNLGSNLSWRFNYLYFAWMRPLLKDQRIEPMIADLESKSTRAAIDVRAMLESGNSET
ncbi:MAG: hypothetical protein AAF660_04210, partial [Pseudomonadota bacterium]